MSATLSSEIPITPAVVTCLKRKREEETMMTEEQEEQHHAAGTTLLALSQQPHQQTSLRLPLRPLTTNIADIHHIHLDAPSKRSKLAHYSFSSSPSVSLRPSSLSSSISPSATASSISRHHASRRRSPLSTVTVSSETTIPLTPAVTVSSDRAEHEASSSSSSDLDAQSTCTSPIVPTTTTTVRDLQDSLVACRIDEPKQVSPLPNPFGFDTSLSNIQYGYCRSTAYRFTSPLSPQPEKRRRSSSSSSSSKSRKHRSSSSKSGPNALLKLTLHRNHILSVRKRWPDQFRSRLAYHHHQSQSQYLPRPQHSHSHPSPDSVPPLDEDDDDEFDDDEDDELIEDDDDDLCTSDSTTTAESIVDMYTTSGSPSPHTREGTPEPEEVPVAVVPIKVVEAVDMSNAMMLPIVPPPLVISKVLARSKPLQGSSMVNITVSEPLPIDSGFPICVLA